MNAIVPTEPRSKREYAQVVDPIPILDAARFDHMQRIASVMARSSLIPDSLWGTAEGVGQNRKVIPLPPEQVLSNCFLVTNQAVRWGMDPFAVAQCCSVVRGRLMYEGKLVAAVLEAKADIRLTYEFGTWDPKSESVDISVEGQGDLLGVRVSGVRPGEEEPVSVVGGVGVWKTNNWSAGSYRRWLRYRGAREWARAYAPALMLGVYTEDELSDLAENDRANRAQSAPRQGLQQRLAQVTPENGFSGERITRVLDGDEQVDASTGEITESTSDAPRAEGGEAEPALRGAAAGSASPDSEIEADQLAASKGSAPDEDPEQSEAASPETGTVASNAEGPVSTNSAIDAQAPSGESSPPETVDALKGPDADPPSTSGPDDMFPGDLPSKMEAPAAAPLNGEYALAFSQALFRGESEDSLVSLAKEFRKTRQDAPARGSATDKACELIFNQHAARTKKRISADMVKAEVARIVGS